jgi:hypothetical protein
MLDRSLKAGALCQCKQHANLGPNLDMNAGNNNVNSGT